MGFTEEQTAAAEAQQWDAARDTADQVRLVAGPGTGKTHAIQKRVLEVLRNGANPDNVYVISFTRATCEELKGRIRKYCAKHGYGDQAEAIHLSTMHSLALYILRRGNQLTSYPCEPTVLDDWEQNRVYDIEFASSYGGCTPGRAKRIRQAHDAAWETLDPGEIDEKGITEDERNFFNQFHGSRTRLYSSVLPGEIINKCVEALELRSLDESKLPNIEHLIVDEYQDLNKCDQKFIRLLCGRGAKLFVAGDDDQSIYSTLRHAHWAGIVHFGQYYPDHSPHELTDCFRCAPAILEPAKRLIAHNEFRLPKRINALYAASAPPVPGYLRVWSFNSAEDEARVIAASCQKLIHAGMEGQESEIVILISNRKVQLDILTRELANLGLPFDAPTPKSSEDDTIRAVYYLLRILKSLKEQEHDKPAREKKLDYPAYRSLLCLLPGVGATTAREISNLCINNGANYLDLFYGPHIPRWLTSRLATSVAKMREIIAKLREWEMDNSLQARDDDIIGLLRDDVLAGVSNLDERIDIWREFAGGFVPDMQLAELLDHLGADTETDKEAVLKLVDERLGIGDSDVPSTKERKIRLLTMHGAKGLSGKIVFIPSASEGTMPSDRAISAPGLLMEQRRLFYVSVTRAKAACIISHATVYSGAPAQAIRQKSYVRLTRSEFLNNMQVRSENNNNGGLSDEDVEIIMNDVHNLSD